MTRVSGESSQPVQQGRGIRVKVNLPIFKDEKTNDAVAYCPLLVGCSYFCCLGWNSQHLLPYVFQSLQGSEDT